jgi:hypothetical protein
MEISSGEHIGCLGATGEGKTYFVREVILPAQPRVLVVDSEEGFDFKPENYQVVTIRNLSKSLVKAKGKPFRWAVRADNETDMDDIAQIVLDKGRNMVIYIDELSDFSDSHHISSQVRMLIRKARKRGITVVWGTQRAPGANRWMLANSMHLFIFYIKPDDRNRLKDYFAPETLEEFNRLGHKRHDFLYIDPAGQVTYFEAAE